MILIHCSNVPLSGTAFLRWNVEQELMSQQFFRSLAHEAAISFIDECQCGIRQPAGHKLRLILDDGAVARLALAQRRFCLLALGQIPYESDKSLFVGQIRRADLDVNNLAILGVVPCLKTVPPAEHDMLYVTQCPGFIDARAKLGDG